WNGPYFSSKAVWLRKWLKAPSREAETKFQSRSMRRHFKIQYLEANSNESVLLSLNQETVFRKEIRGSFFFECILPCSGLHSTVRWSPRTLYPCSVRSAF